MSTLYDTIRSDLKTAMKAKDVTTTQTLRSVLSAFTNELVAQKKTPQDTLAESDQLAVIKRLAKQRRDAIKQFTDGNRSDLAEDEAKELVVLQNYLPETMSKDEIRILAEKKLADLKIRDRTDMGKAIGSLMKDLQDRADGADVKAVVEELLS